MKSEQYRGYLFALLATISYSSVYIFSKAAMNEIGLAHPAAAPGTFLPAAIGGLFQFLFFQYLIAFSLNALWSGFSGKFGKIKNLEWSQIRILLLLGGMEILTNTSFYLSILIIPDPSVTSFLGNLYPVILTLMGVTILKERFTWTEMIGVVLALAGAFIVSLNREGFGTTFKNMFIPGTLIVLVNALLASATSIIGKVYVKKLTPELITLNSTFWPLLGATALMVVFGESWIIPGKALANIAAGSFLGPFLGVLMIYYSFKFVEASRSSIIQSLKGIIVLGGAWIYLDTLPLKHQLAGGLLTVAGVLVMTLSQARILRFGKKSVTD